jgi:hypothetical protein
MVRSSKAQFIPQGVPRGFPLYIPDGTTDTIHALSLGRGLLGHKLVALCHGTTETICVPRAHLQAPQARRDKLFSACHGTTETICILSLEKQPLEQKFFATCQGIYIAWQVVTNSCHLTLALQPPGDSAVIPRDDDPYCANPARRWS